MHIHTVEANEQQSQQYRNMVTFVYIKRMNRWFFDVLPCWGNDWLCWCSFFDKLFNFFVSFSARYEQYYFLLHVRHTHKCTSREFNIVIYIIIYRIYYLSDIYNILYIHYINACSYLVAVNFFSVGLFRCFFISLSLSLFLSLFNSCLAISSEYIRFFWLFYFIILLYIYMFIYHPRKMFHI